ncbi:MAG: hypothetical protein KJ063_17775 [Anaerolineae bacterium]|nr:hypothetical protein [Anaerolineae bacterium]
MSTLNLPALQRPAFFEGQRLMADDLADVQTYHRELRWLHNRSLHNWGIAFGLSVTGKQGEKAVRLQGGLALDCLGRELILSDTQELPIPAVAGASGGSGPATYYLTLRYAEDADLVPEIRNGVCGTSGAVRRPEQPLVRWQDPDEDFQIGLDIVVASIQVQNCQLRKDVSAAERRDALPAQQPYVAAGRTQAGQTTWRLWPDAENPFGVATTVATTKAGFRTTPRYQGHVMGPRNFTLIEDNEEQQGVVDGYAQIALPTAASFELIVLLPTGLIGRSTILNPPIVLTKAFMPRLSQLSEPGDLGWHVVWMGVEG